MTRVTHSRGWYDDGWTTLDCYLELDGRAGTMVSLFLPAREDASDQGKIVTVCDGAKTVAIRVRRGVRAFLALSPTDAETRPLQVYTSETEPTALDDERSLGVVLRLLDSDGTAVPWIEVADTDSLVPSNALHPDYALAAEQLNEPQYLLQVEHDQVPADPVLHYLMVGHLTGASPNAAVPPQDPVKLEFGDDNVCAVPQSAVVRLARAELMRSAYLEDDLPDTDDHRGARAPRQSPTTMGAPSGRELVFGTHAFIEGGFCLTEDYGGGAVVFGWALHDPDADIVLATERGSVVPISACFRRVRADVGAAFPSSPWAHMPSAFIGFVPDLKSSDELRVSFGHGSDEIVMAKRKGFETIKGTPADVAKQLFSILTPADEFAERVVAADWPLLTRMMLKLSDQRQHHTPSQRVIGSPVTQPKVSIIIPLYGRFDFIEAQIMEFARDPIVRDYCEVIYVVDDPSIWADAERLADESCKLFDYAVTLVGDGANRGFSGANNLGASVAKGEFLLFLNSDVIPVEPGWLIPLAQTLDDSPDVGAVAPRLVYPGGGIQHAGMAFKFNTTFKVWTNVHPGKGLDPEFDDGPLQVDVPAVTGACLLMRREHYDQVGGWDEGYLIGDFEDSDLCLALRDLGLRIVYDRSVTLVHLERQSFSGLGDAGFRQMVVLANAARHQDRWAHILHEEAPTT